MNQRVKQNNMESEVYNFDSGYEEHQVLSSYLKDVHLSLRKTASQLGPERAWQEHCQNKETLTTYAKYMEKLATEHWMENNESPSRISWPANFCLNYFGNKQYLKYHEKEQAIAAKIGIKLDCEVCFDKKIKLLDVGSCYNPFQKYEAYLDITALDLCPANDTVLECDILGVPIGEQTTVENNKVKQLQQASFDTVVFSFLLEYIPTSELRISACNKAYSLLKAGGLLVICTPDSKHVGANARLMKCWRYTLAQLGFSRIQYNKYKYIHCMAFRKALHKVVASRWALLHKEPFMEHAIHIPQDYNKYSDENEENDRPYESLSSLADFEELPFYNM